MDEAQGDNKSEVTEEEEEELGPSESSSEEWDQEEVRVRRTMTSKAAVSACVHSVSVWASWVQSAGRDSAISKE
jgi:hypothetical protein